jgi:hypothetical protein
MIWGKWGQAQQWVELISASLCVSQDGGKLLGYHVMCGDASAGLGKLPYEKSKARRADPEDWKFMLRRQKLARYPT